MDESKQTIQAFLIDESGGGDKKEMSPWDLLLREVKVIKDSLDKKDIWINKVEKEIIDTEHFQRLREIQQIAFADFVYVGATHRRFDHSLGTLYVTQAIIDNINKNAQRWLNCEGLDSRDKFISRIVALIHDMAHLSYSHIIEDGKLCAKKQWADPDRIKKFIGESAEIYQIIQKDIKEAFEKSKESNWEEAFKEVIEDIKYSLNLIEEPATRLEPRELVYADIVGNTICADILDYIPRDLFYTGLPGQYDDRILSYFVVKRVNGKRRAIIRLYKGDEYRDSVLSSIMEILDLRYILAAKVYYHHTRRKAVAMAVEMVAAAYNANIINKAKLLELGGTSLRDYILNSKDESKIEDEKKGECLDIAKKLAMRIKNRWLYVKLYEIPVELVGAKGIIKEMQEDWRKRFETARILEKLFGLESGDILIYAPSKFMAAKKTLETLVEIPIQIAGESNVKKLGELEAHDFPVEYSYVYNVINMNKDILIMKHKLLWKLSVFVHQSVSESTRIKLKNLCDQWFKGIAPVTLVEATADKSGTVLENRTTCTEIAEGIREICAHPNPSKCLLSTALDYVEIQLQNLQK